MKNLVFCLFFIPVLLPQYIMAKSGDTQTDSLWQIIKKGKEDTLKVNAMLKLEKLLYLQDTTGITDSLAQACLKLSLKLNYAKGITVIATEACGLSPQENLTIIPTGDYDALKKAVCSKLNL